MPPLRELEGFIFQQLFQHMWAFSLVEGVTADQLPGAQPKHWIITPSREEEAVQRWIDGFQVMLPCCSAATTLMIERRHSILPSWGVYGRYRDGQRIQLSDTASLHVSGCQAGALWQS